MALPAAVKNELSQLMHDARTGSKLVASVDAVMKVLRQHNLCWKQRIAASQVGCHPLNRDGMGLNPSEVHSLISDILAVGFSMEEVKGICIEVPAEDTVIRQFNEALADKSSGKLARVEGVQIRYASVAGSHLNAGLNCFRMSVRHDADKAVCSDGRLSMAKLKEVDRLYFEAAESGLEWTVISAAVAKEWPELPALVQSSANVATHN